VSYLAFCQSVKDSFTSCIMHVGFLYTALAWLVFFTVRELPPVSQIVYRTF
jgi:hypothetical protein